MAGTITNWLQRMRSGDQKAVERLWQYFSPDMLRRYAPQCRQLRITDEEDIVSVAFFNLTSAMIENKADQITNRKEFWRLLRIITKRKLKDSLRYEYSQKRGGNHTIVSLHDGAAVASLEQDVDTNQHVDDDTLIEMLKDVASRMSRPEFAEIIELKLQGKKNSEIARSLDISLRTTQYLILEIKEIWCKVFQD